MNKNEHVIYFLGRLQTMIETLAQGADLEIPANLQEKLVDLEEFFNRGFNRIFFDKSICVEDNNNKPSGLMLWAPKFNTINWPE